MTLARSISFSLVASVDLFRRGLVTGGVPALVLSLAATPALAQVSAVQPYYAVVTQDSTNIRCGPSQNFYSVMTLPNAAIVIVDGETQGWNRVLYPVGSEAFVDAKDARLADSKVVLTKPSQLRAINQTQGFGWSWKMLTDAPLATDTSLTLVESIKEGEIVVAYKVVAPPEARGFVVSNRLRRATQSEVDQYWAAGKALPQMPNVTIATAETSQVGSNPVDTGASTVRGALPAANTSTANTTSVSGPSPTTTAGTTVPSSGEEATRSAPSTTTVSGAETSTITDLSDPTPEQLERTFQRVWREPIASSEVDELIAQYEVAIGKADVNQPRRKAALEQRLAALKVRRDFRDSLRRTQQAAVTIAQQEQQSQQQLELAAAARVYNVVGVLQPSTVYNGERLPLMYRIVSVGGTSPRTLGYVRKSTELDLDRYIGQVVGVVGENALDRSLMLNLITPVRVDPLRSIPTPITPGDSAAPVTSGTSVTQTATEVVAPESVTAQPDAGPR